MNPGQVVAYCIDALFFSVDNGWRFMFGAGAAPAIAQLVLSFSLPESPHFQILHNRIAPARQTLRLIYPLSSEAAIQRRIERIQLEVQSERETEGLGLVGSVRQLSKAKEGLIAKLWRDQANRRALFVACGLQFFQQACGFNTLMY